MLMINITNKLRKYYYTFNSENRKKGVFLDIYNNYIYHLDIPFKKLEIPSFYNFNNVKTYKDFEKIGLDLVKLLESK